MSDQAENEVWQGGYSGWADLDDGRQWRVLRAWSADGWWSVSSIRKALGDGYEQVDYEAEPLAGWAVVEVLEEDGNRYETQTGLNELGVALSLKTTNPPGLDPHYLRGELPDDAEPESRDGLPINAWAWSWRGLSFSERIRQAQLERAARQAPAGAS